MTSPIPCAFDVDKDLDDAALWAVIDSAAAAAASLSASSAAKPRRFLPLKQASPVPSTLMPSPQTKSAQNPRIQRNYYSEGEVLHEPWAQANHRPHKIARSNASELIGQSPPSLAMEKHVHRTPTTRPLYHSPETKSVEVTSSFCNPNNPNESYYSPVTTPTNHEESVMRHSLCGRFPTVSLFKEYQNAAMAILEKSDYTMISGYPYIKKTGWRKIAFYFNLSFEIKDKTIEFDDNRNVQRAEFIVRAYMQGGRFSDGWGSCEKREKRFLKPNHDIPSTAETRAKNKACQEEEWPLGLQPLNSRVGAELNGSLSFDTLLTVSPTSSTNSSTEVDSESTGSFFCDKGVTLGSLIGISGIVELSRGSTTGRLIEPIRVKKASYRSSAWLFSLCSRLNTDAMRTSNTPSLGHFLQVERQATCIYKRNQSPRVHMAAGDFAHDTATAVTNSCYAECCGP